MTTRAKLQRRSPTFLLTGVLAVFIALTAVMLSPVGPGIASGVVGDDAGVIVLPTCSDLEDEFEDNDEQDAATPLKLPFSHDDLHICDDDDDWFAFPVAQGAQININATFSDAGGDVDIRLYDPSEALLANSISTTDNEEIAIAANDSGMFTLRVNLFGADDGNSYELEIDIGCPTATSFGGTYTDALVEPLPFPDGLDDAGAINCVTVNDDATINDLMVGLDIEHTWVGDLRVTLEHVDTGTTVVLLDRPGFPDSAAGCPNNDIFVTLSDGAALAAENACAGAPPAISGVLRPNEPLSDFEGESVMGVWRLQVSDHVGGDSGALNSWSLVAEVKTPTATPTSEATATATPSPTATHEAPTATAPAETNTPVVTSTPTATATPEPGDLIGDVDCSGAVNAIDAAFLLQFVAALITEVPCPENADTNEDGEINTIDAALILQFVAGLLSELPPA